MAADEVQKIESRLEALEALVYGDDQCPENLKVSDSLLKVQVSLGNMANKRERIKVLFKKIDDLVKYLNPQYIDRIAVSDAMKLEFILAEEHFILSQAALLEQMNNLLPMLESAHIKAVPEHASRLHSLSQVHIKQQDQCHAVSEEVRRLLDDYNKTTLLLSKQFVLWDEVLTKLEAAKQVKPME
ncbi:dynactin subunit 3 [Protopterus annectens]|uniref:dynactin subunit 3 n=1 Tax=Protopterus annectens TaxID=7888 RepID=UPI001CF958EA|nr:dynactin subunit 3 [Protopterus annectens]